MRRPAWLACGRMRAFTIGLFLVAWASLASAQDPARRSSRQRPADARPEGKEAGDLHATFETSVGNIVVKLFPKQRPKTVENFAALATGKKEWTDPATGDKVKKPLFENTLFHRVIPGFMIQGGDPLTRGQPVGGSALNGRPFGTGGPGFEFEDELTGEERPFAKPCQLAMANHGPNTNGSQFFITEGYGDQVSQLNPRACSSPSGLCGYTRFGEGICGCELVRKIAEAGPSRTQLKSVKITSGKAPACNQSGRKDR